MKTLLKNISFLFILLNNTSFPQFYADSVTPDYIMGFMNIADTSINDMNDYKTIKDYPDSTLEHITELFFKCYDEDPVGF